jgi:protein-disulfide isomerase
LRRREVLCGSAVLLAAACGAPGSLRRDGADLAGSLRTSAGQVTFDAHCPQKGAMAPRCVLLAWSDFECPACAQLAGDVDDLLAEKLPVRFVLKHYPLAMHTNARRYAVMAQSVWRALGAEPFWRAHDALLRGGPPPDAAAEWLGKLGIDAARARAFERQAERDVQSHMTQARALGIKATPLLIVAEQVIPGRVPYEVLRELVVATIG